MTVGFDPAVSFEAEYLADSVILRTAVVPLPGYSLVPLPPSSLARHPLRGLDPGDFEILC